MKRTLLMGVVCLLLSFNFIQAQVYNTGGTGTVPDNACPTLTDFTLDLSGESLANLDGTNLQLEIVCVDISHTWNSDLDIYITAPDLTQVALSLGNGGSSDNYTNTCFSDTGDDGPISGSSGPFTGTFIPDGVINNINNGQSPNGIWSLSVCDGGSGDIGTINSWSIEFTTPPACADPFSLIVDNESDMTADLSWTSAGACTSDEYWVLPTGSAAPTPTTGTAASCGGGVTASGLSSLTTYDVWVYTTCSAGTAGPIMLGSFTTLATPPDNDDCGDATPVSVGVGECTDMVVGTNIGATDSGIAHSCASYSGGDTWFSVVVPASGILIIQTSNVSGSFTDAGMSVYTDCTGATEIDCDDDDNPDPFPSSAHSRVEINDQTLAGTTVYAAVWEFGNNSFGEFNICAWEPCNVSDITANNISACDPLTNEYTVDITVTYAADPGTGMLDINGNLFAITASPQTETLTLISDGNDVDVTAFFTDDTDCSATELALFTAPEDCALVCAINSVTDGGNQTACAYDDIAMTSTYSNDVVISYSGAPATGTLDVTVDGITQSFAITTSPQTVTLDDLTADGNDEDISVEFSLDPTCTASETALFTAPEDCAPPVNDECAGAIDIPVGNGECESMVIGTNVGATSSGITPSCGSFDYGGDVWFKAVVPASGNLIIETSTGGSFTDGVMQIYDACGGNIIECDDDDGPGSFSRIEISDPTLAGTTVYAAVWEYGNNSFGEFNICAWEPCGVVDIVLSSSTSCSSNLYDATFSVTYTDPLAEATELTVALDGVTVTEPLTGSPQTIVLTGLTSDGLDESPTASLDGGCLSRTKTTHQAPAACDCIISSVTANAQMNCSGATYDREIVVTYDNEPTGNILVSSSLGSQTFAVGTSPQTILLSGLPVDGLDEDITVTFESLPSCTSVNNALFTNPVACPPDCANSPVISCGGMFSTPDLTNSGAWNPDAVDAFSGCFSTAFDEHVFQFTADLDGDYDLEIVVTNAGTSEYLDYFYRTDETCEESGWTCLDDVNSSRTLTIPGLTVGDVVYVLIDAEDGFGSSGAGAHDVTLICPVPPIAAGSEDACVTADGPATSTGSGDKLYITDGGNVVAAFIDSEAMGVVNASVYVEDPTDDAVREVDTDGDINTPNVQILDRSLVITPTTLPTGAVTVFLYATNAEVQDMIDAADGTDDISSVNDLILTKFDTDDCADMVNPLFGQGQGGLVTIDAINTLTDGYEFQISISSFSGFQLSEGVAPLLPLKLDQFTAKAELRHNLIEWTTESEINVEDHTLLKSDDATNWEILGSVIGAGTTNLANAYSMNDLNPSKLTYYKLMVTDFDGSVTYSPIVSVLRDGERLTSFIGASPIPTHDVVNLNIYSQVDDNFTITLTDISGRSMIRTNKSLSTGEHQVPLDLSNIPSGVYMVTVTSDYVQRTLRVIKN